MPGREPTDYAVVINHEEQYSIFPKAEKMPPGFKPAGFTGSADECLAYIKKVWKDISPEEWKKLVSKLK